MLQRLKNIKVDPIMNVEKYNEERSKLYTKTQTDVFQYVNPNSIFHYLRDVKDKDVLDVGCGNGVYSRLVKMKGAKKVVGVDLSPYMINLAKQEEILNPIGCDYKVVDAANEEIIGEFDAVICVFVLVYADTDEKLSKFCKFIYRNLKMGGICVCLIRNCLSTTFWGNSLQKYGSKFILLDATRDGGFACKTCIKTDDGNEFVVTNYVLKAETYKKCFLDAGFKSFEFKPCLVDKNCPFPPEYWDEFNRNPHQIVIIATK